MPYTDPGTHDGIIRYEKASRFGHSGVVLDDSIWESVRKWTTVQSIEGVTAPLPLYAVDDLKESQSGVASFVLSIDGSTQGVPLQDKPSLQFGCLQISAVRVKLEAFVEQPQRFVDPVQLHKAVRAAYIRGALPGVDLSRPGASPESTWRYELYNLFKNTAALGMPSLLDLLIEVYDGEVRLDQCPGIIEGCHGGGGVVGRTRSSCPDCGTAWWPTDALRCYSDYGSDIANIGALDKVMNIAERLWMCGYMKYMPETMKQGRQWLFMTDGPLAIFGASRALHARILRFWQRETASQRDSGLIPPMLVGVEKTGTFVEYAQSVAADVPPRNILWMDQQLIAQRVLRHKLGDVVYGANEFYGRRMLYKTARGAMLVISVPPFSGHPYSCPENDTVEAYPQLRSLCDTLDLIDTKWFKNALVPVVLSHGETALPKGLGSAVLEHKARTERSSL